MADDIGRSGEDPRDVARRRLNVGRRAREADAARRAGQASGPPMTPSTRSMVPYRENLPAEGGRGGPPAPMGNREVGMPRGENLPAVRREGMPAIRVPPGAADMMRSAMQSPAGRAIGGGGRAALPRAAAEGLGRLGAALLRMGRSPASRMPGDETGEGPAPTRGVFPGETPESGMQSSTSQAAPTTNTQRRTAPRPAARESMTADDLNEIVLRLNRGETPTTDVEKRIADRMGIAYKKGGMVNKYRQGGSIRQGIQSPRAQEGRAEMAEDVMKRARKGMGEGPPRRVPNSMLTPEEQKERTAPLTDEEKRRIVPGYKKGGNVKAKTAMKKGGAVAPKKMKAGGKVAPKKMMKGGMTSKPKKMMGGGKAMYAKGGMTRGCK